MWGEEMTTAYDFSLIKMYLHISPEGADHILDEMPAVDFFQPARLEDMLRKTGETVQAIDNQLAGSFFGTSLCNLCITKLYFLSAYNKVLDLSLDHLLFQIDYEEGHGHAHLGYKINQLITQDIPSENGEAFVLADWEHFIVTTVRPAVEAIASAASMKPEMIWQQFGGLAGMMMEFVHAMQLPEQVKDGFNYHFKLLTESISLEVFNRKRNPFQWTRRYVANPLKPDENWVMRSSCCLFDRRADGTKCYVCPRMTPEEREVRSKEMLERIPS